VNQRKDERRDAEEDGNGQREAPRQESQHGRIVVGVTIEA
jgi:hypothetical protein